MQKFTVLDRLRIPTYDNPKHIIMGDLEFDSTKCRECGICIRLCPGGCILSDSVRKSDYMDGGSKSGKCGLPRVDKTKSGVTLCIACFDCGAACPHGAISIKQNFQGGRFYKRLTQIFDMRYPKKY